MIQNDENLIRKMLGNAWKCLENAWKMTESSEKSKRVTHTFCKELIWSGIGRSDQSDRFFLEFSVLLPTDEPGLDKSPIDLSKLRSLDGARSKSVASSALCVNFMFWKVLKVVTVLSMSLREGSGDKAGWIGSSCGSETVRKRKSSS